MRRRFGLWASEALWAGFLFEGEGGGAGGGAGDPAGGDPAGDPADPGKGGDPAKQPTAYELQLRKEAAENRKRAEAAEKKLKEREDADLSEAEKLKKAATEAQEKLTATEAKARERLGKADVQTAAAAAKFIKPGLAYQLVKDALEFDDDGEPTNAEALVKKLAEEHPYLVETAGGGGGGSTANPPRGATKLDPKSPPSWGSIFRK